MSREQEHDPYEQELQNMDMAQAAANEKGDKAASIRIQKDKEQLLKRRAEQLGEKIQPPNKWELN